MANRDYNICYAQSLVFMFHELLRFMITKQSFLHLALGAAAAPLGAIQHNSVFEGSAKIATSEQGETFF